MEIRITHLGRLLLDVEISPDAQLYVKSLQPSAEHGGGAPAAVPSPQYVWGATNEHVGGFAQQAVAIDCATAAPADDGLGTKVTDGLLK